MPHHISSDIHRSGNPHSYFRAVRSDLQNSHITTCRDDVVIFNAIVDDVADIFALFNGNHRFSSLFVFVNCYSVIDAFVIFQKQCRTANQTAAQQNSELFCPFRNVDVPFVGRFQSRVSNVSRDSVRSALTVFQRIHDVKTEAFFHLFAHDAGHTGVFLLRLFFVQAGYYARNFSGRSHRTAAVSS